MPLTDQKDIQVRKIVILVLIHNHYMPKFNIPANNLNAIFQQLVAFIFA